MMAVEKLDTVMLDAALSYAARGWLIFPVWQPTGSGCACNQGLACPRIGKHPLGRLVPNGLTDATADPAIVSGWWTQYPLANIAVRCGAESGLVVLDVDAYKGGAVSLEVLEERNGKFPYSLRARTGSGGASAHVFMAHPRDSRKISSNSSGKLGPGLDIKADGGYVILAPSLHASGGRYMWLDEDDSRIEPAPEWFLSLLGQSTDPKAPLENGMELPEELGDELAARLFAKASRRVTDGGARHDCAVWFYTQMKDNAVPVRVAARWIDPLLELCREVGATRQVTAKELKSVLSWAYQKERRDPYPSVRHAIQTAAPRPAETDTGDAPPANSPSTGAPDISGLVWKYVKGLPVKLEPVVQNLLVLLSELPDWRGCLGWNEFAAELTVVRPLPTSPNLPSPRPWRDVDATDAAGWFQASEHHILISSGLVHEAALAVAQRSPFHPVRQYLSPLEWDGVTRIDGWLEDYFGTSGDTYTAAVGARWLISAVARIFAPGAKADHCLILEGVTGIKKSTALSVLFAPWFTDEIDAIGSKEAAQQLQGVWCVELAELDALGRADVSRIKAFMSKSFDRFRPPYGRTVLRFDRQCVFAGSVNHSEYLRDETGNRRFWPVACGSEIDIPALSRNRDQLWAEAVVRYRAGASWYLETPELVQLGREAQEARYVTDEWETLIAELVELEAERLRIMREPVSLSMGDCLKHLRIEIPKQDQASQNRVARCLKHLGFERRRVRAKAIDGGGRLWRYFRKSEWSFGVWTGDAVVSPVCPQYESEEVGTRK